MATNTIQTRIQLKYDTLSNWLTSSTNNFKPLKGEVCIAEIPTGDSNSNHLSPPAIGIKIGDGSHTFLDLPWIQAIAGDVYSWAKASTKPTYDASEIQNLNSYISGQINDTDTQYQIVEGTGDQANKYYLQSKTVNGSFPTLASTDTPFLDLTSILSDIAGKQDTLAFDGTYNASTNKVATESTVTSALSGLGTAASSNVATAAISDSDSSTDLPTKAQVATYVASKVAGLSGAMHYIGAVNADPTTTAPTGTFAAGDVVTYSNSEYVYDGTNWRELGTEGSYALNTVTVTGSDGLTGGGAISTNQTITHAVPSGAAASTKGTSGGRTYIQTITTDKFGHITGTTTATETVTDTTYTFAEGSVNGEFSVTPAGGNATQVKVHGLNNAAYKDVSTAIPASGTADDAKVPTVAAVKGLVTDLDSSVSATAASGNVYSVLTGVTQTDGKLASKTEVTLAAIAKTGSIYDVIEHNTVTENSASLTYLVFDCGDASHVVTDPT